MNRYLPLIIFLLLAAALALAMLKAPDSASRTALVATQLSLPRLQLEDAKGKSATIAVSGTPVVIHFFASWCTPCVGDHAQLTQLRNALPHIPVMGIAWKDVPEHTTAWLTTHGNIFQRVWYDTRGTAAIAMGLRGVPETFVVDRKGVVRWHVTGVMDDAIRAELIHKLEAL